MKKKCIQCKIPKEENEFYISKDGKSGSLPICKKCLHINIREWSK